MEVVDQTTPAADPVAGTPEYDALMVSRAKMMRGETETETPAKVERPEYVPAKFWDEEKGEANLEALAKSYAELEKGRGTPTDPAKPVIPTGTEVDPAKTAVEAAGLDWDAIGNKIKDTGKLEDADYTALEKTGIPRAMADHYIAALKTAAEAVTAMAVAHVGGDTKMNELMAWAGTSLTEAEKTRYNADLAGAEWKTALDTLTALRAAKSKTAGEPDLVHDKGGTPSASGYRSKAEMMKDMSSAEYRGNPVFRAAVAAKMQAATWDLDPH